MLLAWWHLGLYALLGACGVNAICFRYARLVLRCSAISTSLCPLVRLRCVPIQVSAQICSPCRIRISRLCNIISKPLICLTVGVRVRSIWHGPWRPFLWRPDLCPPGSVLPFPSTGVHGWTDPQETIALTGLIPRVWVRSIWYGPWRLFLWRPNLCPPSSVLPFHGRMCAWATKAPAVLMAILTYHWSHAPACWRASFARRQLILKCTAWCTPCHPNAWIPAHPAPCIGAHALCLWERVQ